MKNHINAPIRPIVHGFSGIETAYGAIYRRTRINENINVRFVRNHSNHQKHWPSTCWSMWKVTKLKTTAVNELSVENHDGLGKFRYFSLLFRAILLSLFQIEPVRSTHKLQIYLYHKKYCVIVYWNIRSYNNMSVCMSVVYKFQCKPITIESRSKKAIIKKSLDLNDIITHYHRCYYEFIRL